MRRALHRARLPRRPGRHGGARAGRRAGVALIAGALLAGCGLLGVRPPDPVLRTRLAEAHARHAGFVPVAADDNARLPIAAWVRPGDPRRATRVYVEGDGLAFLRRHERSPDPTPIDPVALAMATADPHPGAVVYLGRPCQFVPERAPRCDPLWWTAARFGPAVVDATDERLDALVRDAGVVPPFVLVGYSGGGVVAALVAAGRDDVATLVTVASPLDVDAWTEAAGVPPLVASTSPVGRADRLATLDQLHFTSARDRRVPAFVVDRFVEAQGGPTPRRRVVRREGVAHGDWLRAWPEALPILEAWLAETTRAPSSEAAIDPRRDARAE